MKKSPCWRAILASDASRPSPRVLADTRMTMRAIAHDDCLKDQTERQGGTQRLRHGMLVSSLTNLTTSAVTRSWRGSV